MTFTPAFQHSILQERRLRFMRSHQEAFDVEPEFPLPLLENLAQALGSRCVVELSCKVESNQLFAARINICYRDAWPQSLGQSLKFLDEVESRVGIQINRDLLQQFLAVHINSNKILWNTTGIDLRPNVEDSSVKIHIGIDPNQDTEELVMTAIGLDGSQYSPELIQVLLKDSYMIGFDFFLNGRSEVELYTSCPGGKQQLVGNQGIYLKSYAKRNFSEKVFYLLEACDLFMAGFSKANTEAVIYFGFNNIEDMPKYFLFTSLGQRIYDFCRSQGAGPLPCVGVTQKDLESHHVENLRFYYRREFS
ncbi:MULTISPECIES: LynF/TruF/PatF family peptide O-prenyltransferase [unclassified Tolypothrix]|uniref:LynF/TruF/PatF family peptide O-prenyltransferase n=1 Tax=unclassified Tolypothrix TaxID=2649714 RepID=UPI0005EAB7B0|nr:MULTISPECIES: LynF/TruF/PatF family peptide O-prenyltransferase [unclassified Tolypothrix]BAY89765.1 hypothetical protein NIES3275_17680 [Microchaete diplosiphon NIES-3275]EKF00815.1 hypothetical protein FDUTEX481_08627 [Tolypothrix sp. PCC 7601]MBE9083471.1 LynF/TruF/PatF family peptide O-prenyltransferase [Tolypothrix sp. LEGE 11397]UYD24023.1 LynF/TruF/PatF family peptide O-prenyltransferase [Tolypothrix sp. PCC 7712]UYD33747.1 LynF/TruF/PatF family peptide O-prenyltransferase [Tolypothr